MSEAIVLTEEIELTQFDENVLEVLRFLTHGHLDPYHNVGDVTGDALFEFMINEPSVAQHAGPLIRSLSSQTQDLTLGAQRALGRRQARIGFRAPVNEGITRVTQSDSSVANSRHFIQVCTVMLQSYLRVVRENESALTGAPPPVGYAYLRYRNVHSASFIRPISYEKREKQRVNHAKDGRLLVEVFVPFSQQGGTMLAVGMRNNSDIPTLTHPSSDNLATTLVKCRMQHVKRMKYGPHVTHQLKKIPLMNEMAAYRRYDLINDTLTMMSKNPNHLEAYVSSGYSHPSSAKASYVLEVQLPIKFPDYTQILKLILIGVPANANSLRTEGINAFTPTFCVTAMGINYPGEKSTPSRSPWMPMYNQGQGCISKITPDGQIEDEVMSRAAALTDQWTNIRLDGRTSANTMPDKSNYTSDAPSITKGGLELEDVEYIEAHHPELFKELYDFAEAYVVRNLIGEDENPSVIMANKLERSNRFHKALFSVLKHSGPCISHSGIIRVPTIQTDLPPGQKAVSPVHIVMRIMLSRLVTVGYGRKNVPFHMYSPKDMHALKVPMCVSKQGLLLYTLDHTFLSLIERQEGTNLEDTTIGAVLTEMRETFARKRDAGEPVKFQPGMIPTPDRVQHKVIGIVTASPFLVTEEGRSKVTHTVITSRGEEICLDDVINDAVLELAEDNLLSGGLIWTPDYCIILAKRKIAYPTKSYAVFVVAGPRLSRFITEYKNSGEVLTNVLGEEGDIHFAAVSRTGGYAGALARAIIESEDDDATLARTLAAKFKAKDREATQLKAADYDSY